MNKDKIAFRESLKDMLRETFKLVEGLTEIKAAKKAKSDSLQGHRPHQIQRTMDKCRQELEDWMFRKTGQKELPRNSTLMGPFWRALAPRFIYRTVLLKSI